MKMNNFHIIKANPVLSLRLQVKNPLRTTTKKYEYLNFIKNILSDYNCLKTDFTGVRLLGIAHSLFVQRLLLQIKTLIS